MKNGIEVRQNGQRIYKHDSYYVQGNNTHHRTLQSARKSADELPPVEAAKRQEGE